PGPLMALRWYIDECSPLRVSGWIDDNGPVERIEIAVNGEPVGSVLATNYRKDLADAGIGDGRRAFSFPISRHLVEPDNRVTISHNGLLLHSASVRSPRSGEAAGDGAAAPVAARPRRARRARPGQNAPLMTGDVRRIEREVTASGEC